ncbi:MAG: PorP/SprF family type IX secretion system membrane protein [Flavobacteriaceae bacterium]|jgi:type IX secretion system PorP/SprF family membrane protein
MKEIYSFFLPLLPLLLWTQQDTNIVFYQQNLQLFNPAATGLEDHIIMSFTLRSQWAGINGAPDVQLFKLSIPEGEKRLGYGAILMLDQTFIERQTRIFANFSYRLPFGRDNSLFLGIQAGGNHINLDFDDINMAHDDDGKLGNLTRFYPNVGVGIHYKTPKSYISLSAPFLIDHKNEKNVDAVHLSPSDDIHLYFSGGLHLPAFARNWSYVVYGLVRWVQSAPITTVINAGFGYQKSELLFAYHHNSSLGLSVFFDNGGPVSVGYAYQSSTPNLLSKLDFRNHELILRIRLNAKKDKIMETDGEQESNEDRAMN